MGLLPFLSPYWQVGRRWQATYCWNATAWQRLEWLSLTLSKEPAGQVRVREVNANILASYFNTEVTKSSKYQSSQADKQERKVTHRTLVGILVYFVELLILAGFVGTPLPGVEVRIVRFFPGQEDYQVLCEGSSAATKVMPECENEVSLFPYFYRKKQISNYDWIAP